MAPSETLLELLSAPQPRQKEIGERRLATSGDPTMPHTRVGGTHSRYELIIPPDLVASEVKDPGFAAGVLAQNPDHLFNQATQFRLRSQITAELVALLSLPSDQVQLGRRELHREQGPERAERGGGRGGIPAREGR